MSTPTTDKGGVQQAIRALRADGWELRFVDDGEEYVPVTTETGAIDAIFAVDCSHLFLRRGDEKGWMFIVLGNSPEEVICDYTVNLTALDNLLRSW